MAKALSSCPVRATSQFAEAIRTKLVREIAGAAEPEAALVKPAQDRERMNCLIGEIQRRQRPSRIAMNISGNLIAHSPTFLGQGSSSPPETPICCDHSSKLVRGLAGLPP
jgi:hypothetical protein